MEFIIVISLFPVAALIAMIAKRRSVIECASISAALFVCIASITVALKVASSGDYAPSRFFIIDALGALVMLIISCVGCAAVAYSIQYLRKETAKKIIGFTRVKQYFILLNLFLSAMLLAVSTSNPIFAWISIEATTLSTAFLISFYNKPSAMEAAWKYLIINSIGLLLGFFGTLLYFTASKIESGAGLATWHDLLSHAARLDPMIVQIAFIFILIGYGTKVGFAPMHTWLPDAHRKAPAPISALLSGVLLNVALLVVLRFKVITDAAIGSDFSQKLFIAFGLLSILVSALIMLTQKNYKRLLAYSSIENMGITALGFGFGGLGIFAAILHMLYHALVKSALFLTAGNIFLTYGSTKIANVKGVLRVLPITSVLFFGGVFIFPGPPRFGFFLKKFFIFSAGILPHPAVTVIAVLLTTLVFIGLFKHATSMVFGDKPPEMQQKKEDTWLILPPLVLFVLALCIGFYQPQFLQILLHNAAVPF